MKVGQKDRIYQVSKVQEGLVSNAKNIGQFAIIYIKVTNHKCKYALFILVGVGIFFMFFLLHDLKNIQCH